jgi:hypothetical protein
MPLTRHFAAAVFFGLILAWCGVPAGTASNAKDTRNRDEQQSAMGRAAARARAKIQARAVAAHVDKDPENSGNCFNEPECEDEGLPEGPSSTQSETTIAVDRTGRHVVIGFNDFRGFSQNPISVSGFMYSDDGGETFIDGGQLPSPGTDTIGTTKLPQVFGDPDVKYIGGCTFIYSSIIVAKFSATQAVQTMGVHRSTDCGHTWTGPFEVTAATNPNGLVDVNGAPLDDADKEFLDVDPDTGRVIMSWTNFTPTSTEMTTTYSDDFTTGTPPTWSLRQIVSKTAADGQASIPRFAGHNSSNAYIAWTRFFTLFNNVAFARSVDNGATWSAPVLISPGNFFKPDEVLGNDRKGPSPSLAVDQSFSPYSGNIYIVYPTNDLGDGGDIAFQTSADEGFTFSPPLLLNSRPGNDRSQWFPWVTVDSTTGRVHVFYYDQGVAVSGDLTQVTHTYSDDGGTTWKQPLPLTRRPFHAGWGNDTGAPNLGDYNQAVAQGGDLFVVYAEATRPPAGFADGQPTSLSLTVPDVAFNRLESEHRKFKATTLDLGDVTFTGGGMSIEPGDRLHLTIPLRNYVTNPLNADTVGGIFATLTENTPGVRVIQGESDYKNVQPGDTETNKQDYILKIDPTFVPGSPIELELQVNSGRGGSMTLFQTLFTEARQVTTLLREDFEGAAVGSLPTGWTSVHGGGANVVPWTTTDAFCGTTSKRAFHQNAADGPGPGPVTNTRWERLFSPPFVIPGDADYVTIDMDVCYDTEDDPSFNVLAYDGLFLRIFDGTLGRLGRSVLVEAFADEFTTGSLFHYPKHLPRNSNPAYFEDMSAWAGWSHGVQHVHMRLPGMAGSVVQLRFEYAQDAIATCSDVRPGHVCGVSVDNILVRSATSVLP